MKILVMGSGGVGGFYGGRLAHSGCDVTFVARGAHLEAMRTHGLVIENKTQGDIRLSRVKVTDDPASVGTVDLVLIAVKLWDTESAARAVKANVGPRTAVLSLQNGVIKDDILREEFGAAAVIGGAGYVATHIACPGVILQTGNLQRVPGGAVGNDGHDADADRPDPVQPPDARVPARDHEGNGRRRPGPRRGTPRKLCGRPAAVCG
jgi:2-dehydropantoate 2-reductase